MPFAFPYLKNLENENEYKNEKRETSNQKQKLGVLSSPLTSHISVDRICPSEYHPHF